MKQIPSTFINEVLVRSDLVELIEARVPLRKKGVNYVACCPFHNEKTPSFTVNASKQLYYCFGCGVGGNAISFLMEYDHLPFVEAVEVLANQLGLEIPREAKQHANKVSVDLYQLMEQANRYYQGQLRHNPVAIDYLKQRGLSGQMAKEFGIGYAPPGWDGLLKTLRTSQESLEQLATVGLLIKKQENNSYYDRFRDRIMFPIRDRRGRVIGFGGRIINTGEPKYLNSPETPIFHKGKELYGLYEAYQALRTLPRLLVVEGYMDVVALAQHGIRYAVATLGTAITADHIQALFRATQEVIFCFDGDRAGQAAAWRALEVALPLVQDGWQLRFLLLPSPEDPDSLIRKEGTEKFEQRINQAISLADFLFDSLSQQVDLSSLEGKARLTKLATPLINQLTPSVLQHMLFERLASIVRMDVATLKSITHQPENTLISSNAADTNPRRSPMRHAIILLLQNPQLILSLPEEFDSEAFILPGSELLQRIVTLLKRENQLNTAAVIEYWREDAKAYQQLTKLAATKLEIPDSGLEQEFLGTLQRLEELNRDQRIEQLKIKLTQNRLSEQEKQLLYELLAQGKKT